MTWILTVMVLFHGTESWGHGDWGLRARFLTFLLCMLCSCTSLGPPYMAKTMVAGLDSLLPHKSVHRQKMTVCPGSLTFIREAALSHKHLYQTFPVSLAKTVKCPPHLVGRREYQDTRISSNKLQALSSAEERTGPLLVSKEGRWGWERSWVGNQQHPLLLRGLSKIQL